MLHPPLMTAMLAGAGLAADTPFLSPAWALGVSLLMVGALIGWVKRDQDRRLEEHAGHIGKLFSKVDDRYTKDETRKLLNDALALHTMSIERKLDRQADRTVRDSSKLDAIHTRMDKAGMPNTHDEDIAS